MKLALLHHRYSVKGNRMKKILGLYLVAFLYLIGCFWGNHANNTVSPTDESTTLERVAVGEAAQSALYHLYGDDYIPTLDEMQINIITAVWETVFATEDVPMMRDCNGDSFGVEDLYVLDTVEYNEGFYSVVMVACEGQYHSLVKHSDPKTAPLEILHYQGGAAPMSIGSHLNYYFEDSEVVLWVCCKKNRWDPVNDNMIPNNVGKLVVELEGNNALEYELAPAETFIFFAPENATSGTICNDEYENLWTTLLEKPTVE